MAAHQFAEKLIKWYQSNGRDLPWRNTTNPYSIWLSETILQQTRVAQGMPYYERFLSRYPTLADLANAQDDDVMKLWQGLGYYSRARNMLKAARYIHQNLNGEWPTNSKELQKLSGIGPYTSAAIASFAFGESVPVIDGNVYRVVSRYLNIDSDISQSSGKKDIQTGLNAIFDSNKPAEFNQAIMDLGAVICTPKKPSCDKCPVQSSCLGFREKTVDQRPVKSRKTTVKNRFLEIFIMKNGHKVGFLQRPETGVWSNLWTFPILEFDQKPSETEVLDSASFQQLINNTPFSIQKKYNGGTHLLSHRKLHLRYWEIELESTVLEKDPLYQMISWDELHTFAVPKPIEVFFKKRGI